MSDFPTPPGPIHSDEVRFAYWLATLIADTDDPGISAVRIQPNDGMWADRFEVGTSAQRFEVVIRVLPPETQTVGDQSVENSVPVSTGGQVDEVEVVGELVDSDPQKGKPAAQHH